LKIARKGRIDARHRRQIRRRRRDRLDSGLLVVGDDRHPLARLPRPGGALLQDLDLAIDTQDLRHFLLELGIATLQIVAHLVRLFPLGRESCTPCPGPGWQGIGVPPTGHARAHGGPAAASSTVRAGSRAPWPCRTPKTPARPWPPA